MRIKWPLFLTLIVSFLLFTGGCFSNPFETFKKASEKTANISKGKSSLVLTVDMQFDERITSMMEDRDFKPIKVEQLEVQTQFDKTKAISQSLVFAKVNDLGVDAKVYQDGGITYLITPLLPKILVLYKKESSWNGTEDFLKDQESFQKGFQLTEGSRVELKKLWKTLLTDENVTRLGNIVSPTPDGDVKAKEYQVNLTSENLRPVLLASIDILAEDPLLAEQLQAVVIGQKNGQQSEKDKSLKRENLAKIVEEMWRINGKWVEQMQFGSISYLAYIDRDGYIIQEKVHVSMDQSSDVKPEQDHGIKSLSFSYTLQRWDIGKDIDVQLPEVSEENSMTLEEMEKENGYPIKRSKGEEK